MENFSAFFLKRPLFVNIFIIIVYLMGFKTLQSIQKEGFPAVSQNQIVISTIQGGSSARDIELNITNIIEEELEDVANIKEITSSSKEGVSTITVFADEDLNERQFDKLYDEVGTVLSAISDLPTDIEGPSYSQVTSDDRPIIELAINGPQSEMRQFVPFLVFELRRVPGISKIDKVGFPDEELHILVDPKKANAKHIDLRSISKNIQSRNIEGSGGTLESYVGEKKVVAYNKYESIQDVLDTNIRRNFEGQGVKLKDVAVIQRGTENLNLRIRNDGKAGVSLVLKKKSNGDLLDTISQVREIVSSIKKPESISINMLNDQSQLTRDRLSLLSGNALTGIFLVFVVLFLVFGFKTASWTAMSIPFSFFGLFIFLPFFDITLNSMALGGCVLVLGMLVDDAIVVAEQINQEKENGFIGIEAAKRAVGKVWLPILGASLTTMIAYYPISQLGGLPGKFVWIIPTVVSMALLVSLVDTYFLLPSHLAHGKAKKVEKKTYVKKIESLYSRFLYRAKRYRYGTLLVFFLMFASAGYLAKNKLKKDPFPQDAADGFTIQLTAPSGISFDKTESLVEPIEKELLALPKEELLGFSTRIGTHSKSAASYRGSEPNQIIVFVYLTSFADRERTAEEISSYLRERMGSYFQDNELRSVFELMRIGPPLGRAYEVRVSSFKDELRTSKVKEIKKYLGSLEGVLDVADDNLKGKRELNIKIDYDRLAELRLSVTDVLTTLRSAFDGIIVSDMVENNRSIDFRLRLNERGRANIDYLNNLGVTNTQGNLIQLKQFIRFIESDSVSEIKHVNAQRTTTIYGQIDKNIISPTKILSLVEENFESNKDVQVSLAGEPIEQGKIFENLGTAGIMAVVGVFLIISLILGNLTTPLVVMSAVPFGIVGIIYCIYLHGLPISMFVLISVIGLTGIIVNDSLVMVFRINELMTKSADAMKNIVEGATSRLRPVLLTTFTTVCGLLPTAYGIGGSDPFITPMCLALAYGLLFGTLVILILVPTIYLIGLDIKDLFKRGEVIQS